MRIWGDVEGGGLVKRREGSGGTYGGALVGAVEPGDVRYLL